MEALNPYLHYYKGSGASPVVADQVAGTKAILGTHTGTGGIADWSWTDCPCSLILPVLR
jgi:hypothetical protein